MRGWIVRTLIKKELLETVRDRRALFLMTIFPFLLYPVLMLLSGQLMVSQMQQIEAADAPVGVMGAPIPDGLKAHISEDSRIELVAVTSAPEQAVLSGKVAVVLEFPADFSTQVETGGKVTVRAHFNATSEKSQLVMSQLRDAISSWKDSIIAVRLKKAGLSSTFADPLQIERINTAPPAQVGGYFLGRIVPLLLITMVLLGAFYPAVEVTAGEKERGTLQTLLTAPITPMEIVTGKFVSVCAVAALTATANVLSLALMFGLMAFAPMEGAENFDLTLGFGQLLLVGLIAILIGLMVSAAMMTIAVVARTLKEAQAYLSPVMVLGILPGMVAMLPGIGLDGMLQITPMVNQALLLREVLEGTINTQHIFVVFVSSLIYTLGTLVVAARIFEHEAILLGEAGIEGLLAPRSGRLIMPADALALTAIVFVLLFYGGQALQSWALLPGLAITQWVLIGLPCLALVKLRKSSLKDALGLRLPSTQGLLSGTLFGASLWYPIMLIAAALQSSMAAPDERTQKMLEELSAQLLGPDNPTWLLLAIIAFSPAVCEEFLFRGILLRSMVGRFKTRTVVLTTAFLFGAFHMSAIRFVPTAGLGIIMALLAIRTGSLLPSMVLHFLHNGLTVLIGRLEIPIVGVTVEGTPAILHILIAAVMLGAASWLLKTSKPRRTAADRRT
ncbi:MAG: sodium transport system permease protein [Myxococcota bacterium]|jgi:sodium transport system permease protein